MATAIVAGALANKPRVGGSAWVRLSWVIGLARLGFDVYFLEEIERTACVDELGRPAPFGECVNRAYFDDVVAAFDLTGVSALIYEQGEQVGGATWDEVVGWAEAADLLVNISGHLSLEPLLARIGLKVFVDTDPGYTQIWHAQGDRGARVDRHDLHFTIGENIGRSTCSIPTGGIRWRPTRQPVILDQWPVAQTEDRWRFTSVGSWRGAYGRAEYDGATYGLKAHEFRKFVGVPTQARREFELVLDIDPGETTDLRLLRGNGWQLVDKSAVAWPASFRSYVQSSGAEFSVAQGIYVETDSGWFSDRTTRYLASGKPALVQDTGFSRNLPVGEGLVAFRTLDEALAGAATIEADYDRHARAAREVAEAHFASDIVLEAFVSDAGVSP